MKIDDFIKQHKHICYCEAIIFPNGDIEYAIPSHQMFMINLYCEKHMISHDEFNKIAKQKQWYTTNSLLNEFGCVAVWYDMIDFPYDSVTQTEMTTQEQFDSIDKLTKSNCVNICKYPY